jgi:hypothetical protein
MKLSQFWNKAIEFYCTYKSPDRLKSFDTVFISISEESLNRVHEKYLHEGILSIEVIDLLNHNIESVGGILNSYYAAVRDIHNDFNSPAQYSFLRFSILVIGAYKQDCNPLRNFWRDFDSFLEVKGINIIPKGNFRTKYLQNIISNLSKLCTINHHKTFFDVNVFGDDTGLVNVGKIKAHSIFQGRSLVAIKKAIYALNYSDTHNVEDLSIEDIEKLLKATELTRILKLFQRDNDTKEIILICLQIWLKNWFPNQEEKIRLLKGSRGSEVKQKLQIKRIWEINNNNKIEIKFGFFIKSSLGDDNIYYLNKDKNVFVDVAWGIRQNENRILYFIENYSDKLDLNSNDFGYQFESCTTENNRLEYVLEKIPHLTKNIFLELSDNRIKIQDNPIIIASKNNLESNGVDFFYNFSVESHSELSFNLYRINEEFTFKGLTFVKTNNLNIYPVGITDGRPGVKSFLSSFPIKIKFNNLSKGEIHVFKDNQIAIKTIVLSNTAKNFDCEEDIGKLDLGKYHIRYLNDQQQYDNFISGHDFIEFEIVESGSRDSRNELKINTVPSFDYHEFRISKEIKNLEDSCLILHECNSELKFKDKHTYFYFDKNDNNEWIINRNRKLFFIQRLKEKPTDFIESYSRHQLDFEYLSKKFVKYDYQVSFCESPHTICLSFNIKDFYQSKEIHRITTKNININCYYFKLDSMDVELKQKYPSVEVGDVIYVISNKFDSNPENFIKLLNQEVFPFKKQSNAREDNQR